MRAVRPASLTLLAALAALAVAAALFAIYVYPAYAQEGSAPDKPRGLEATATHGQVVLTWDDPEDDSITGYVILRRVRVNDQGGDFSELVADTGTAALTYTDDTVAASTTYTYRIKAINQHGTSERSRWYHIDTPAPPVPDKPRGLEATATHGQVLLTWDDPDDDSITGYVILRRNRDTDAKGHFDKLAADTGTAAATYTDDSVSAETRYTYRIKAINQYGVSERSRWYHIATPASPEPPANSPATGAPTIIGTVQMGETLRVDTSGIADEDGLEDAAFSYQWLADGTAISEATARTYTPVEVDEGKAVTVQVNFTDDAGNDETLTSAPTAAVAAAPEPAANSAATGAPIITGTVQVGETLRVDTSGIADEDGLEDAAFSYQWLADGTAISEATARTYTPVEVDEGKAVTVQVNFTDDAGNDETLTSAATAAVAAAEPTEPPAQPMDLSATATHDSVTLTWDDPGDESITGYAILRRNRDTDAEGHFNELVSDTGSTATTYTDGSVAVETRYTYRIKAINEHGASERSRWFHIDTQAAPGLEPGAADQAPANLTAVPADGQVVLSWDAPAEDADTVTGYEVLRAEGQGELSTLAADTGNADTTYTDATVASAGASYAYRVKAIRDGERSGASNEARVQLKPAIPIGLFAGTVAHNSVTLTWDEPNDDEDVTGYAVVRWTIGYNATGFVTIAADTGTADPSYTDETVEPENEYLYHVRAINAQGGSEQSEWLRVHTSAAPDPALFAPSNLTVELVDGRVSLGWDAPAEDAGSVTGYEILRARGWDDPVILVADTGSAATAHTDETADAPGESYAYRVKAIRDGERSQASDPAVIQLPEPPPSAPAGLIASFGVGRVFLSWQAPVEDADTVTGYEVLRAQGEGELTILVGDTGNAATTYTDATAGGASERYAYRVRAIRDGERSADSNEARVQLPPAAPRRVLSAAASDLVLLSWADPSDDSVTGYRIMRRQAIADVATDFLTLAEDTGSAETGYADDTVENGRVYVYRVLALGPGGVSEPSRDVRVRTTVPVPPPDPQRGLPSQGTPQPRQSVSEPSGDDFPEDGTTTGRLEVNNSVTGNIDENGDQDAFAVELVPGRFYRFDLEGSETGQGTLADPMIHSILDTVTGIGISLSRDLDSGEGENSRLTFNLRPVYTSFITGDYHIVVSEDGENATGTYRLSMVEVADSGYSRTMPLEGRLQPGGSLSGTLGVPTSSGIFSYYFAMDNLEVGRYTVDFGTGGIHSIHHLLTDRGRSGNDALEDTWIIVDQGYGRRSFTFDVRPGMEGTHYVLLNILKDDSGSYTATLQEAMPHLRVGRTGVVGEVPAYSGGFASYMEFFSVDLEAGQKYQVDIKGKHSRDEECEDDGGNEEACTLDLTMLGNIQAPDGDYVGGDGNFDNSDDDVGGSVLHFYGGGDDRGNTRFTFTAEQGGTHFLKVGGRLFKTEDGSGFRAGTFRLSVREVR